MAKYVQAEHYGEVGSNHLCIAWLVEHAAFLCTMFGIGRDGKEPYKLLKGKSWHGVVYEFGEGVQYKPIGTKGRYKLDDKVNSGIFSVLVVKVVNTWLAQIPVYIEHVTYTVGLVGKGGMRASSTLWSARRGI